MEPDHPSKPVAPNASREGPIGAAGRNDDRSAVPGLLLGAAVLVVALGLVLMSDPGAPPVVRGSQAPTFELPRLASAPDGDASSSSSTLGLDDLEGRIVLVNFWATWCEPCESEMPAMERLYQALPRDQFELVAVSIDVERGDVEAFQAEYKLSFPIVLDRDQSVYNAYQTMGVPESLLIDRQGRVVERYVGPKEWDASEYVERVLELTGAGAAGGTQAGVVARP
jgi:cytochrome c biogenesis protein CcmG/thiol:disulfide interchange protein DsbE